jgi:hypothetical protein
MRAYNDRRVLVEYARVNRVLTMESMLEDLPDFGDDLGTLLESLPSGITGDVRGRSWRLGNVDVSRNANGAVVSVDGAFGWFENVESAEVPPPYEDGNWKEELGKMPRGALAIFTIEADSQYMAITSDSGDVRVPSMCRAFTDLLRKAERAAEGRAMSRASREWFVDPKTEGGSFRSWLGRVDHVRRVTTHFHLPNPEVSTDIQAIVDVLSEVDATSGSLQVEGDNVNVDGNPIVQASVTMEEHDYGSVSADGDVGGQPEPFKSQDHIATDRIDVRDEETLSRRGVMALMRAKVVERIRRGLF